MPGVVELRLGALYTTGSGRAPKPGSTAHFRPFEVREAESCVRAAMRNGRISMAVGQAELRLLSLCHEALGETDGGAIPVRISDEQDPIRSRGPRTKEKKRQKDARKKNRRQKKKGRG